MKLFFSAKKAAQLAAVLLRFADGKMEYLRLLKLLYIADRESLLETGRPLSMSQATAMEHGMLSSEVYDLVKGSRNDEREWSRFIHTHAANIELVSDPGRGQLSKYDIDKLNEISARYEHWNTFDIAQETHGFGEYIKTPRGEMNPVSLESIIDALGLTDRKDEILSDLSEASALNRLFAG